MLKAKQTIPKLIQDMHFHILISPPISDFSYPSFNSFSVLNQALNAYYTLWNYIKILKEFKKSTK